MRSLKTRKTTPSLSLRTKSTTMKKTKRTSRKYNSLLASSRALPFKTPSLKSIIPSNRNYSENIIPSIQLENYVTRMSVYPKEKHRGNFDDYKIIYLSTHASYPNFNIECSDINPNSSYPEYEFSVVDDMVFTVPEDVIIIDPTNHGGVSYVQDNYDYFMQMMAYNNLDDLIRNRYPQNKKHHEYISQYLKLYETGSYFINLLIGFEKTSDGLATYSEFWGVYEQPKKSEWGIESCSLKRTIRSFRHKPGKQGTCTSLRNIIQYFKGLPENKGQKLAFVVTSCRVYPEFNNLFDNLEDEHKSVMSGPIQYPSVIRMYLNNYFHIFAYLLVIPIIITNGYIMADKYYENPRNLIPPNKKFYREFFAEDDQSDNIEDSFDNYEDNIRMYNEIKTKYYETLNKPNEIKKEIKNQGIFMKIVNSIYNIINTKVLKI
jgi:hypothetical protein